MKIDILIIIYFIFIILSLEKREKDEETISASTSNIIKGILAVCVILHHSFQKIHVR